MRQWLDLFDATYQPTVDGLSGHVRYVRIGLPRSGGVLEQEARTMEALEVLESVSETIASERAKELRRKSKTKKGAASRGVRRPQRARRARRR